MKKTIFIILVFVALGEFLLLVMAKYQISVESGGPVMRSFPIQNAFGNYLQMLIALGCLPAIIGTSLMTQSSSSATAPYEQYAGIVMIFMQACIYSCAAGLFIKISKIIKKISRTSFVKDFMRRDYEFHTRLFLVFSILLLLITIITEWFGLAIITIAFSLVTFRLFIKGRRDSKAT